jgi:rhomboid protease GluP
MAFGITPKYVMEIYLEKFTPGQFLILGIESAKKLDWEISSISNTGFIAFLNNDRFRWNARITFKIEDDRAIIKSESVGNEMFDWGKNKKAVERFEDKFITLKYKINKEELDLKFEELKPDLTLPEQDVLNLPPQPKTNTINGFFSLFLPREGYFITPILIDLNILIYILMVCTGVNFFLPDGESLLKWGANFRPLTIEGEWWRLVTNCFLHIGILHLLMNMYALLYIGLLLEPRIGSVKFAIAYFITGITASIASLWWHEMTISAGASGAIFGLYGVFLALLTTNLIEKAARKALLASIGLFVGYNLLYGMKEGIDSAAHIGGLAAGLIIGFSFYPLLTKPDLRVRNITIMSVASAVIFSFSIFLVLKTPDSVGKYDRIMKEFAILEQKAMSFYNIPEYSTDDKYLDNLRTVGIPDWKECRKLVSGIDSLENLPAELLSRAELVKKYCDYRLASFELMAKSIERSTDAYNHQINIYNQKIELIIKKLNGESIADSSINIVPFTDFAPALPKGILYVVDGQPVDDISNIKQENIKSVIVLKPPASSEIYGKRGDAGAVMIETR